MRQPEEALVISLLRTQNNVVMHASNVVITRRWYACVWRPANNLQAQAQATANQQIDHYQLKASVQQANKLKQVLIDCTMKAPRRQPHN